MPSGTWSKRSRNAWAWPDRRADVAVLQEHELLPPPRRTFYQKYEAAIVGGVAVVLTLAVWEAFWSAGKISPLFFTGPSQVVERFVAEWTEGRLKQDIAYSGTNFVIGVGMAITAGVVLGVIIGWYRRLAMVFEPFLTALYSTPRVALIPLVLIWFGIG